MMVGCKVAGQVIIHGLRLVCILLALKGNANAFTGKSSRSVLRFASLKTRSSLAMSNDSGGGGGFFNNIPSFDKISIPSNLFANGEEADQETPDTPLNETFEPLPENLIARAKTIISTDLGIQDPNLLNGESFIWIGPLLEKPLGKIDYVAAGNFFNVRGAFPDFDYRAHDFRVDANNPMTVRCTVRPVGSMRGSLRLRNEILEPNGKQLRGPPEGVSITFDSDGRVVKLCSGFSLDRGVGNTNGLCGVMAAATIAGVPPSDWEVYPVPAVISRFFGRPLEPLPEVSTFLAPFPETVMIQLVKGIISANLGADDSSLLASDFTYLAPWVGPIGKGKFLEDYASQEFGGYEPECSHYRVDPYDPYRVWVDIKVVGVGVEGPPQAFSFAFDDDGFCTRITGGAVLDPTEGNTGGLSGQEGIRYALGDGKVDLATRPLPVAIGRLKKTILSPITNIDADDYILSGKAPTDRKPEPPTVAEVEVAEPQLPIKPKPPVELPKVTRAPPKAAASKVKPKKAGPKKKEAVKKSEPRRPAVGKSLPKKVSKEVEPKERGGGAPFFSNFASPKVTTKKATNADVAKETAKKRKRDSVAAAKAKALAAQTRLAEEQKRAEYEKKKAVQAASAERAAAQKSAAGAAAAMARRESESKRAAQAEAAKKLAVERKVAAQKARQQLESMKVEKAALAKKQAEERQIAAQQVREAAEAERAAAAEERRRKAQEIKDALEQKKQEIVAKREAAAARRRTVAPSQQAAPVKGASPKKQASQPAEFSFPSFFGSPKQSPPPSPKATKKAAQKNAVAAPKPSPATKPAPASFFSFGMSPQPKAAQPKTKTTQVAKGPVLAAAPDGVPTIVKWRQTPKGKF